MKDKFEIAVSGAAQISHCCKNIKKICEEVGKEIALQGCNLVTGATTGAPYIVAKSFKKIGGFSIGFSPAASESAHLKTYKLPVDVFDDMIYTGADYAGRNIIMTKSVDGVIIVCGRMGTLHEFLTAFELKKPVGVLEGTGGAADKIRAIASGPHRGKWKIIYDTDPKRLVKKLIKEIKEEKGRNHKILK
jgi:hypothetical protein